MHEYHLTTAHLHEVRRGRMVPTNVLKEDIMSKTTRHYYAAYHAYDIRFVNDVSYIVRFDTRAERDEYVDGEKWDGSNFHHEAITAAEARKLAPNAFRVRDFERDMDSWVNDGHPGEFFTLYDFC